MLLHLGLQPIFLLPRPAKIENRKSVTHTHTFTSLPLVSSARAVNASRQTRKYGNEVYLGEEGFTTRGGSGSCQSEMSAQPHPAAIIPFSLQRDGGRAQT